MQLIKIFRIFTYKLLKVSILLDRETRFRLGSISNRGVDLACATKPPLVGYNGELSTFYRASRKAPSLLRAVLYASL